jgi:hypothetical protein
VDNGPACNKTAGPVAIGLLDFYHASQPCWNVRRGVRGEKDPQLPRWMDRRLHWLRHGQEERVRREAAGLKPPKGDTGRIIQCEQTHFGSEAQWMDYQAITDRDWPMGSGSGESARRQKQCRFRRPGKFWTQPGLLACRLLMKLAATITGTNSEIKDNVWMCPLDNGALKLKVLDEPKIQC